MTAPLPEIDGLSIVLLGAFNPRLFTPSWFARHGLLPESVEAKADVPLINNDYSSFSTDWCSVEVLPDRFHISSTTAPAPEQLRDLVVGTFDVLHHVPIHRVGLNSVAHYMMPSQDVWNSFGHRLAPKETFWDPVLDEAGTLNVTVLGQRKDQHEGATRVTVEPSSQVAPGIFISTNDDFGQKDPPDTARWAVELISTEWEPSRARTARIREHLISRAIES